ncbi:MAG: hypothetical protein HBSIN02_14390 [Bacteroidia bacterium]|nr:MAG: hypothetical protein HBSIN02_14390 [Bacteroidia bacterium]
MQRSSLLSRLALAAILLYFLGVLIFLGCSPDEFQWDFRTYYYAAQAFLQGQNPYPLETLKALSGDRVQFRYVYPPLTLWVFTPFALLPFHSAAVVFLVLKAIVAAYLVRFWGTRFLQEPHWPLFVLFCLFGLNAPFYTDFSAGNISVFEQLVLWAAFSFFLYGRYGMFCGLILIAASFKLLPLLFLALLLVTNHPRRYHLIALSTAVFAASLVLTSLVSPELFASFLDNLDQSPGRGIVNPSSLAFFTSAFDQLRAQTGLDLPPILPVLTYGVLVFGLLVIAVRTIRPHRSNRDPEVKVLVLFFLIVTSALVLPRFKDYSFILLILPAYVMILRSHISSAPLLLILFVMPFHSALPGLVFVRSLANYSSLLLAGLLFYLYRREIRNSTSPLPIHAVQR